MRLCNLDTIADFDAVVRLQRAVCAGGGNRTHTRVAPLGILSSAPTSPVSREIRGIPVFLAVAALGPVARSGARCAAVGGRGCNRDNSRAARQGPAAMPWRSASRTRDTRRAIAREERLTGLIDQLEFRHSLIWRQHGRSPVASWDLRQPLGCDTRGARRAGSPACPWGVGNRDHLPRPPGLAILRHRHLRVLHGDRELSNRRRLDTEPRHLHDVRPRADEVTGIALIPDEALSDPAQVVERAVAWLQTWT